VIHIWIQLFRHTAVR